MHRLFPDGDHSSPPLPSIYLKLLRIIEETAHIGFFELDIKTRTWAASPFVYNIFELESGGKKSLDEWLSLIQSNERSKVLASFEEAVNSHQNIHIEYCLTKKVNGNPVWIETFGNIRFYGAEPHLVIGTIMDISDRKLAEEKIKTYQDHLEDLVERKRPTRSSV